MRFTLISDLDPQLGAADLFDRGLHYGDGLFETMLLEGKSPRYWQQHYQRLQKSAERLDIACPSRQWLEDSLQPYVDLNRRLVIKLILTRGSGGRGLKWPETTTPHVYLLHYPANKTFEYQSIRAYFSEITLPQNPTLAGLKHLNRLDYVMATRALHARPDCNEALLGDANDSIIEGIVHNLFWIRDGLIHTPELSRCGVAGICRALIIDRLRQQGQAVGIKSCSRTELLTADECFMCNSVRGVVPVVRIEDRDLDIGPLTKQLQQEFHGVQGR